MMRLYAHLLATQLIPPKHCAFPVPKLPPHLETSDRDKIKYKSNDKFRLLIVQCHICTDKKINSINSKMYIHS